ELLDAGREVRQAEIRECIYIHHDLKASPNLVNEEIKRFWSETGPILSARLRRPGVPNAVCEKLDEIWDVALKAADETHAVERKAL
ncbi:DNA-binding protein, partial [Klebsiella pneumoniae]